MCGILADLAATLSSDWDDPPGRFALQEAWDAPAASAHSHHFAGLDDAARCRPVS